MAGYVNSRADPAFAQALAASRQRRQDYENDPNVQRRKRQAQMMQTVSSLLPLIGGAAGAAGGGILGGMAGGPAGAISGAGAGVGTGAALGQAGAGAGQMLAGNMTAQDDERRAREAAAQQSALALMQLARR